MLFEREGNRCQNLFASAGFIIDEAAMAPQRHEQSLTQGRKEINQSHMGTQRDHRLTQGRMVPMGTLEPRTAKETWTVAF